tara:strand:- start:4676 stop:4969 length:294 start_codon:yes stop_codon:yes gene_type:complete
MIKNKQRTHHTRYQAAQQKDLDELLVITMEECAELIQVASKAIRCGTYYDNDKLTEEVGDVLTMIDLLHEYDLVSWNDLDKRKEVKLEKLKKWSNLL